MRRWLRRLVVGEALLVLVGGASAHSAVRAGQATRSVSGGNDWAPSWSADGKRLVFVHNLPRRQSGGSVLTWSGGRLSTVPLSIGKRFLTNAVWSSDGKQLLVAASGAAADSTWLVTARNPARPFVPGQNPAWRPNTATVALFTTDEHLQEHVVLADAATGKVRATAATGGAYAGPSWSSDGRYLAGIDWAFRIVILDGGTGRVIYRQRLGEYPVFRPRSTTLAVQALTGMEERSLDGKRATTIVAGHYAIPVAYGPNGAFLVYADLSSGLPVLWTWDRATRLRRRLGPTDGPLAVSASVSSNGRIAFVHREVCGFDNIEIAPAGGGQPINVTQRCS